MAKNVGMIKFTGTLGDISGRITEHGNILQTKGGFDGERIRQVFKDKAIIRGIWTLCKNSLHI